MNGVRILTIGIAPRDYIRTLTIEIAGGKKLAPGEPRHWVSSMEALGKILSEKNMLLIDMIRSSRPDSVSHLAKLSGRAKTNLSKTLNAMNRLGLVEFELQKGGKKAPRILYDGLSVKYPCAGEMTRAPAHR